MRSTTSCPSNGLQRAARAASNCGKRDASANITKSFSSRCYCSKILEDTPYSLFNKCKSQRPTHKSLYKDTLHAAGDDAAEEQEMVTEERAARRQRDAFERSHGQVALVGGGSSVSECFDASARACERCL